MTSRIQSFINQFNDIFNGNPWLDETFSKKLDSLSEARAFSQAPGNNHSVAEVVSHVIEWRKEVIRRLADNSSERKLTEESGLNWKGIEELQKTGWQQLYEDLKKSQQQILNLLENKNDSFLDEPLGDTDFNKEYFVAGLLHHDIYHLGQIGLILKWAK
jgi:uncharacterized damage-inducible protein DinB